jgi:hypothetical protein
MSRSLHHIRLIMTWPLGSQHSIWRLLDASRTFFVTPFPFQAVRLRFVDVGVKGGEGVAFRAFLAGFSTKARDSCFISPSVYILFVVGRRRRSFVDQVCFAADGRASRYVDGIKFCLVILNFKFRSWPMSTCPVSAGWWSILGSADPCLFCFTCYFFSCKSPVLPCFKTESYCSTMYILLLVFGAGDKHLFVLLNWKRQVHL